MSLGFSTRRWSESSKCTQQQQCKCYIMDGDLTIKEELLKTSHINEYWLEASHSNEYRLEASQFKGYKGWMFHSLIRGNGWRAHTLKRTGRQAYILKNTGWRSHTSKKTERRPQTSRKIQFWYQLFPITAELVSWPVCTTKICKHWRYIWPVDIYGLSERLTFTSLTSM